MEQTINVTQADPAKPYQVGRDAASSNFMSGSSGCKGGVRVRRQSGREGGGLGEGEGAES